jgi:hypothetical protein
LRLQIDFSDLKLTLFIVGEAYTQKMPLFPRANLKY